MADRIVFDEAALKQLFSSTEGPAGKYLKSKGIQVQRRAKRLAPVDTGRLRASITEELSRDDRGLVERIGTDVEYAPYQEFGTSKMAAHPFLRPALAEVTGT